MTDVIARIKIKGKHYETTVNLEKALAFRKGVGSIDGAIVVNRVFSDFKKGFHVSEGDLKEAFGTTDAKIAIEKIIRSGEVQVPQEHRDKEQEDKKKKIVDFLSRFALDPRTNLPHPPSRISAALDEVGINVDNRPAEQQISGILGKIQAVLPIKIQSKKLKVRIPAQHTGRVYGILQDYKESENWLSNGDLECVINLPVGLQDDFYSKLNSITHGSAITQEMKE